jgi:hypothetical protein
MAASEERFVLGYLSQYTGLPANVTSLIFAFLREEKIVSEALQQQASRRIWAAWDTYKSIFAARCLALHKQLQRVDATLVAAVAEEPRYREYLQSRLQACFQARQTARDANTRLLESYAQTPEGIALYMSCDEADFQAQCVEKLESKLVRKPSLRIYTVPDGELTYTGFLRGPQKVSSGSGITGSAVMKAFQSMWTDESEISSMLDMHMGEQPALMSLLRAEADVEQPVKSSSSSSSSSVGHQHSISVGNDSDTTQGKVLMARPRSIVEPTLPQGKPQRRPQAKPLKREFVSFDYSMDLRVGADDVMTVNEAKSTVRPAAPVSAKMTATEATNSDDELAVIAGMLQKYVAAQHQKQSEKKSSVAHWQAAAKRHQLHATQLQQQLETQQQQSEDRFDNVFEQLNDRAQAIRKSFSIVHLLFYLSVFLLHIS